ncbi:hypothetical protein RFI_14405 [Reticulomyxa filosa]|uniref:Uncharacterized protein n=1 Tax=Reticulomyxa filosa TaxID=46433 RepID=X6NAJ4_RETFI|nr:hypothetical protein RFI_14405 [Reticulomyxa filosa]|eukprot:ETO22789.1 hypothetical protein RFI_14405 [Reticulomyxa filosa]
MFRSNSGTSNDKTHIQLETLTNVEAVMSESNSENDKHVTGRKKEHRGHNNQIKEWQKRSQTLESSDHSEHDQFPPFKYSAEEVSRKKVFGAPNRTFYNNANDNDDSQNEKNVKSNIKPFDTSDLNSEEQLSVQSEQQPLMNWQQLHDPDSDHQMLADRKRQNSYERLNCNQPETEYIHRKSFEKRKVIYSKQQKTIYQKKKKMYD